MFVLIFIGTTIWNNLTYQTWSEKYTDLLNSVKIIARSLNLLKFKVLLGNKEFLFVCCNFTF